MRNNLFPISFLYTPGMNVKKIYKSLEVGADVSVFDLEDSVPKFNKQSARNYLNDFLLNNNLNIQKAVRINSIRCKNGLEDIIYFIENQIYPDIFIMTMVDSHQEILILKDIFNENNIKSKIYVTIETPLSLTRIQEIASCCDGLILGSADLAAFLGAPINWSNMLYARQVIANAAATYNISAIDTACYVLNSKGALIEESEKVKELGFHGKAAVHPSQVEIINKIFYPNIDEINNAREIVRQAALNNGNIVNLNGQMIGPPFVTKAKLLLERFGYNK